MGCTSRLANKIRLQDKAGWSDLARLCLYPLSFFNEMKVLILAASSIFFAGILGSCDGGDHASESGLSDAGIIGNKRCDIHQKECLVEDTVIMVSNGPSYPEGYWEARRSEEYPRAVKQMFPNANSGFLYAVPGSDYAKQEGGKMIRRYHCPECREAEQKWHAWYQENKKRNKPGIEAPRKPAD